MTGPIARIWCPHCDRLVARRRDGRTPYGHRCTVGTWCPTPRARCRLCGAYVAAARAPEACLKCARSPERWLPHCDPRVVAGGV